MRLPTLTKILAIGGCLVLLVSGCLSPFNPSWPLLYKPSCDFNPILTMYLPEHINTLASCPKDKMIVENGINKNVGRRQPDDIKELFFLTKDDTEYEFDLCFSDISAVHLYESNKHYPHTEKYHPVFQEAASDGRSCCVYYTEQERADPEGGSGPTGIYYSRASFRLHNAFIQVTTTETNSKNDKLTIAVKDLAQMLSGALSPTNQITK